MTKGSGGYDGGSDDDLPTSPIQTWYVEEHKRGSIYQGVLAVVSNDDGVAGTLKLNNEEEFEWLKKKLHKAERRRTDEELTGENLNE